MAGPKRERMPFSGMIKLKLIFLKVCRIKSLERINFIFLSVWNVFFFFKYYMTQNISTVRRKKIKKEKEGRRKRKREKKMIKIAIVGILHTFHH